jgi:ankyrin repeat protein
MLTSYLPRFRWVACQLDHLCNLTTDRERLLALQTLPPTLYSTYDRILERLNEKGESACRLVERVLKWLSRPTQGPSSIGGTDFPRISARELCVAISIEFGDTTTTPDDIPSVDGIMVHSSSFLRIDKNHVWFAHYTVEEYLVSIDPIEKPQLARYRCDEHSASTYVAETCLTFLNLDDFRPNLCANLEAIRQLVETHPFYVRASVAWSNCTVPSKNSARALQLVDKLFSSPDVSNYENWLQVRLLASRFTIYSTWTVVAAGEPSLTTNVSDLESPEWNGIDSSHLRRSIAIASSTSKMHIAAMFHLVDQIPGLFGSISQLNELSPFGTTLHCALFGEAVITMIMENWLGPRFAKPEVDHDTLSSTVTQLVQLGADAKIPLSADSKGIVTPLYLATFSSATQQLLDVGAVLDESTARAILQDMDDGTELHLGPLAHIPLESVKDRDRHHVGQLLMRINPEKNLAVSHTTLWGQATLLELEETLRHACQDNQLSVFRWIFETHHLDVNHRFRDDFGENESLILVACGGFAADIVAYLVEHGVEMNALGSNDLSPLEAYFTSSNWNDDNRETRSFPVHNCLATFHSIIGYGANLHGLTNVCDSALISWAKGGTLQRDAQEEIVRVLLEQGVDVGWKDSSGKNVWHYLASGSGIKKSNILKTCADPVAIISTIDIADDSGFTPILEAVEANDVVMFEFFIEQGCSVTSKTHKGESILHLAAAAIWSNDAILQSLLSKHMHPGIATSTFDGSTVAHRIVKSITDPGPWEHPPAGMRQRFEDSMAALKDSSISITDTDRKGKTPLDRLCQWIAEKAHEKIHDNDHRGDARLDCFEVLVAYDDARDERLQSGVTWTAVLLRGLAVQASYSDVDSYHNYPPETACSRAVCFAIDRGLSSDGLGSELDQDSIFDIAVRLRQESLIFKLLDKGINFDKPSRKEPHYTPLQSLCACCCPVSTIHVAISRTRDVCGSDIQGLGPLHLLFLNPKAQYENIAPSIRALLDAGVDINEATNQTGRTALMMAAASKIDSDAVGTLLGSGANFNLRDANGWNALLHACESGTESAIRLLIDAGSAILHKPVKVRNIYCAARPLCGPIQLAAARGMSNIVKLLLESGRSVGNRDNNEVPTSPLLMACVGNQKTVRLLLSHGYNPNFWDTSLDLSPLHVASWAGETQIVRVLLEAGCDKEASDASGLKAWMLAIMKGDTRTADMLDSFTGEHISQAVSREPIRLLQSAEHRNVDSATTKKSADKSAVPIHSHSMTSYAVHRPHFGRVIVRYSLPVGMRQFLIKGCQLNIRMFVKGGMNMEGRFKNCTCTPMLIAVSNDALDIVEYLVTIGVPLFTEDQCSTHAKLHSLRTTGFGPYLDAVAQAVVLSARLACSAVAKRSLQHDCLRHRK